MLKKYRNLLATHIQTANMDPRMFNASEEENGSNAAFRIRVRDHDLLFFLARSSFASDIRFDWLSTQYILTDRGPLFSKPGGFSQWGNFEEVEKAFQSWLDNQVRMFLAYQEEEANTPDLW